MQRHKLTQGSPEWLAHRLNFDNASDAPAMMGCSPYKTRQQLLHERSTGITPAVNAATQRLFDSGHLFEAFARPLAEETIGDDLYPQVGTNGTLSASFDGLTMCLTDNFEHKRLNKELRAALSVAGCTGADLPLAYRVQMEQQHMVSGAKRTLFMASDWTPDGELIEELHCWYTPNPELAAQIAAGWAQFHADLADYVPPTAAEPVAIAEPVQSLPAISVIVSGKIDIRDNLKSYETTVREFLDGKLIRKPKTDLDFLNLDAQIKTMKAGRDAIKGAVGQVLGGVEAVDITVKTLEMLDDLLQKACAASERTMKEEKERRKTEIVTDNQVRLRNHLAELEKRVGVQVSAVADFGGVIKGLKSLDSMEDKLSTELARVKIEANRIADLIQANRTQLDTAEAGHLFPDFSAVCTKSADDFANLITSRKAAAQARQDAEREKIRAEEVARLAAEAARKEREEAAAKAAEAARLQREQEVEAPTPIAELATAIKQDIASVLGVKQASMGAPDNRTATEVAARMAGRQPTHPAAAALRNETPTLKLGDINTHIAPLSISTAGLLALGFEATPVKGASLYREAELGEIIKAMHRHLGAVHAELLLAA